jgi:RNA polymerase sigma-70 factor (ECF subfamily)
MGCFKSVGEEDAELVMRARSGDSQAARALWERYGDACTRYARRMLGSPEDAEDAVQETFMRAFQALGEYRESSHFRAWLYRILTNQCLNLSRSRKRDRERLVHDEALLDSLPAAVRADDLQDELQKILGLLEAGQKEAFVLRVCEGLEYKEIAEITGVGVSALKMRVMRAWATARPLLEEWRHEA